MENINMVSYKIKAGLSLDSWSGQHTLPGNILENSPL